MYQVLISINNMIFLVELFLHISSSFTLPLDCIQNELLSYTALVENIITLNVISQIETHAQEKLSSEILFTLNSLIFLLNLF